jgi:hypothetical protein
LDASGNLQTTSGALDANWQITNAAIPFSSPNAYVVDPTDADWYIGWFANGPKSSWICANPFYQNGNGNFTATLNFTLTQSQVNAATIGAPWMAAIDDEGSVDLNGNQIAYVSRATWNAFTPVTLSTADLRSDLHAGTNSLVLQEVASDYYLEAVRFEGTLNVPSGTPEPFTIALSAAGIGLAARRKLKNRKSV